MNDDKRRELCTGMAKELPLLRKAMNASQQQLAGLAGVSRSTINNIERNKTMGWNTFLSLLMIFTKHEDAMKLIGAFGLYPPEVDEFLSGKMGAESCQ